MSLSVPFRPDPLARPAKACGALIALTILLAAFAPRAELPGTSGQTPVEQVALRFADAPDGVVLVSNAASGATVGHFAIGEGGFVRSTVRGLAYERRRRGLTDAVPFELSRFADGRLVLSDPETDRTITLNAFGGDNEAAFAAFLDHGRTSQ